MTEEMLWQPENTSQEVEQDTIGLGGERIEACTDLQTIHIGGNLEVTWRKPEEEDLERRTFVCMQTFSFHWFQLFSQFH